MTRRLSQELVTRAVAGASLEWLLTDPLAFGLTTASPLQRAICRIADGIPLGALAHEPTVIAAVGDVQELPHERPSEMVVLSGIRTAKSLIAACRAFHMAVSCDTSRLRPGETPRVSVVSLSKDLGKVIMGHLVGSIQRSPLLRTFILPTTVEDGIMLRHPSGTPVEVCVAAGARAGSSLIARWSAGIIFDEFPRMVGGDDGVVNWDDQRNSSIHRMLDGSQMWHIGSPWAPYGPAYDLVTKHHGHPSAEVVVVRAPAWHMNPVWWTPERIEERRRVDPEAAVTELDAQFQSPEQAMFSVEALTACTRKTPLVIAPKPGNTYFAAMDPATRGNGWTLVIATRENGKAIIVRAEEWIGSTSSPLKPDEVIPEMAGILAAYGVRTVHSDQVMGDALVALGRQVGLSLVQWTIPRIEQAKKFLAIRTQMDRGLVELPPVPRLRTDLLHIRKKVTPTGVAVEYPMTSDGRHCDYGPSLMLVLTKAMPEPVEPKMLNEDPETARMRAAVFERFSKKDSW